MSFEQFWDDYRTVLDDGLDEQPDGTANAPLLAHYTSLENLENILSNNQFWLSNPLYMNDLEEVRFGVVIGSNLVHSNDRLRAALLSDTRRAVFYDAFSDCFTHYDREQVLDLYVMCFSEHDAKDSDGRLSMWRGYGDNGKGAAIAFDVSGVEDTDGSPFVLAPVQYATQSQRMVWLNEKIVAVSDFIDANEVADECLNSVASALSERIVLFAIFSKHIGFEEEHEWRLAYLRDRDKDDVMSPYLSYANGSRGLQPKLKLDIKPIKGALSDGVSLDSMVDRIIVGPSVSSPLLRMATERMLKASGKENFLQRLKMSSIPYRDG